MLITKFSQMSKIDILVRSLAISLGLLPTLILSASAEITATTGAGSTGTTFAPGATNTIDITGGQSSDNKNLFHSFGKFNVDAGQFANFKPDAGIQNILGRVTDGASLINGGIKVNGGSNTSAVNLFLMNPAGIVFGKNASLDINGAFTATTAKAIDFNGKWFNAVGTNNYTELTGNPIGLAFTGSTPGSIFSAATLANVQPGKSITLVGGTVISTGDIKTAGGNISIATVEGGKYVQIKVEGSILGLSLPTSLPTSANSINSAATNFTPLKLAELLTNTGVDLAATGVKNENGVVTLVGNPAAVALIPALDKAIADYDKALADSNKANADSKNAEADYNKALAAVGGNQAAVDPKIVNAKELASKAVTASNGEVSRNRGVIRISIKTIDTLSAVGEPSATLSGDTISKPNRAISSGDVITRNFYTTTANGEKGGNVYIKSSQAILIGNINPMYVEESLDPFRSLNIGGNVFLDAQTELKTKQINTSIIFGSGKERKGGDVTLTTQTKDIIVSDINTRTPTPLSGESVEYRGGDVTVNAAGLFRVIDFVDGGITTSVLGVIKVNHGSKKPFAYGVTFEPARAGGLETLPIPGFIFPNGASGSRGGITTSVLVNGFANTVYKDQPIDGSTIAANNTLAISPVKKDRDDNSGDGKTGTEVAKNTSGDNSEEQDSTKQKTKCSNNSSAIASAKLGTDPTRSGNSANSAAEEFCPPKIDNGILQILIDRN
jgi:filamentous hemagglutinin family protein